MVYEFKCPDCGHIQEEFMKMDDRNNPVLCSECGKETSRQMSPVPHKIKYYKRLYGKRIDGAKLTKG